MQASGETASALWAGPSGSRSIECFSCLSACPISYSAWLLAATIVARAAADEAADQYSTAAGHYAAARWQMAADEFAALLTKFPEHPRVAEATFFRGEALVQLGQPAAGRTLLRRSAAPLARQPTGSAGDVSLAARRPIWPGTTDGPMRHSQQFVRQYPGDTRNAYALVYLAETTLTEGDAAAASGCSRKRCRPIRKGRWPANAALAWPKPDEALGNLDDARQHYEALAGTPGPWPTKRNIGWECWRTGPATTRRRSKRWRQWSSGQQTKRPIPQLVDKAATARGWALYKLQRYDEAEECLTAAVERDAANEEAQYCLGLSPGRRRALGGGHRSLELVERQADRSGTRVHKPERRWRFAMAGPVAWKMLKNAYTAFCRASRRPNWPTPRPIGWPKRCCRKIRLGPSRLFESLLKEGPRATIRLGRWPG